MRSRPGEFTAGTVFTVDGAAAFQTMGAVEAAIKYRGVTRWGLIRTTLFDAVATMLAAKTGTTFTGKALLPPSAIADHAPYAQQLMKGNPQFIVTPLPNDQAAGINKALKGLGYTGLTGTGYGSFAEVGLRGDRRTVRGVDLGWPGTVGPRHHRLSKGRPVRGGHEGRAGRR